jgi:cytochrome c peroxidase
MSDAKVFLGKRLFYETRLSSTARYSCSACHNPGLSFTDGRARSIGATGDSVRRAAMNLANAAYSPSYTWGDPSVRTLEMQMRTPLFNRHPVEMGLKNRGVENVAALAADADYVQQFAAAFPNDAAPMTMNHVIMAIASFERTLISGRSPFDRYVFSDDAAAMSESAKRGMSLFFSARVGCSQCHSGLNFSGPLIYQGHEQARAIFANNGLYNLNAEGEYPHNDQGLIEITHAPGDMGKFKVPTLRNVALTAPYMHDGSVATLELVLNHYAQGGQHSPLQDRKVKPVPMSAMDRRDLLDFLDALTDNEFVQDPRHRP